MLHMLIPGLCYKVALLVARLSGGHLLKNIPRFTAFFHYMQTIPRAYALCRFPVVFHHCC
jgi:hypothetical protein